MSNKLSVLMTVYNEGDFVDYAIRACLPHVDHLVIVEGAYQETIALGAPLRSTDRTIDIINKYLYPSGSNVEYNGTDKKLKEFWEDFPSHSISNMRCIYANEKTDKDQRNIGLKKIKELNPDGYLLIIDGDEVYTPENFQMVKVTMGQMERNNKLGAYFKSLTFVNDLKHYTLQEFPRLFKLTPDCEFVNDNFMHWKDLGKGWTNDVITRNPYLRYYHYAFCKGREKFELKKKWWQTRFGKPFDYGWNINDEGQIEDPNHKIIEYTGRHPKIMEEHPLWEKCYG